MKKRKLLKRHSKKKGNSLKEIIIIYSFFFLKSNNNISYWTFTGKMPRDPSLHSLGLFLLYKGMEESFPAIRYEWGKNKSHRHIKNENYFLVLKFIMSQQINS